MSVNHYMYKVNKNLTENDLTIYNNIMLDIDLIVKAIHLANEDFKKQFYDQAKYLAALLLNIPLKNLSGAVGEAYGQILSKLMGTIDKNLHESGSPDFLPLVEESIPWFEKPTKEYFNGGFDTKACFTRTLRFNDASASSHHNQTSTVLSVQWGLSEGIPEIFGVYFTNKLTKEDWNLSRGKPGSKTTNAATLNKSGKEKLRMGWIAIGPNIILPSKANIEKYGLY